MCCLLFWNQTGVAAKVMQTERDTLLFSGFGMDYGFLVSMMIISYPAKWSHILASSLIVVAACVTRESESS